MPLAQKHIVPFLSKLHKSILTTFQEKQKLNNFQEKNAKNMFF
jgi:hypothetical protein